MNADTPSSWREYRKRRAFLSYGVLIGLIVIVGLYGINAPVVVQIIAWIAAFLHVVFGSIWLGSFLCPACEHEWFGGERGDNIPRGFLSMLVARVTQKMCGHCGLPKFMSPGD